MAQSPEVLSYLAVRRMLGLLGLALPLILLGYAVLGYGMQPSISEFYHTHMGDFLVGSLIAIGIFLLSYKGYPRQAGERFSDKWVARIAGLGAIGVALFPVIPPDLLACPPGQSFAIASDPNRIILCPTQGFFRHWTAYSWIHFVSAGVFFVCLAIFCFALFPRGNLTPAGRIDWRAGKNPLYFACGTAIIVSILALLLFAVLGPQGKAPLKALNYVFWWETVAVVAFAISWLAKGRVMQMVRAAP